MKLSLNRLYPDMAHLKELMHVEAILRCHLCVLCVHILEPLGRAKLIPC